VEWQPGSVPLLQIMELEDPVEDERGYVYEKAAVQDYIRQKPPGHCQCPVSGTVHLITIEGLRPARVLKQAQRRARQGKQRPDQNRRRSGDVLDLG